VPDAKPSKSERKRAQLELQSLGERLIGLPDEVRQSLALDERLEEAIEAARRMTSHGAIRRQKQYIGKLMRDVDPAPIRSLVAARDANAKQDKRVFAAAEHWRTRLLESRSALVEYENEVGGGATIERLLEELAHARDERSGRRLRRELFRMIHASLVARSTDG
jgi:ribosome-associated protein